MRYRIAPIKRADVAAFHAVLDVVAREKMYLASLKAPPLKRTRKFVLENLRKGNPQFVALHRGRLVGWCDVVRSTRDTSLHCGVLGIGLLPAYRGKGIGRRLMTKTIAAAWRKGLTRIELTVREDNLRASALYKELGFVAEGLRRNAFLIDGKYHNLIAMALLKEDR